MAEYENEVKAVEAEDETPAAEAVPEVNPEVAVAEESSTPTEEVKGEVAE
jgi:hypothetical protein